VKRSIVSVVPTLVLLLLLSNVISAGQQANATKDVYFREKASPLVPIFPVTGSSVVLKNIGHKTITSYTFACFLLNGGRRKIDVVFEEPERDTVPPNETTGGYAFDATPPNMCRNHKTLLGVYQVNFSDGTSWKTTASR
jgi:hypothetical protein